MNVVFFGDSICEGYRAAPGQGWVERLARLLPAVAVVNAGVSGETTKDALPRFQSAVLVHEPGIVYVQFGLNDASWWCRQVGRSWLSEEEYILNMNQIVNGCVAAGVKRVLVASNHPVSNSAPCKADEPTYSGAVRAYNAALRRAFDNEGITFVDMEAIIDADPRGYTAFLDPDGVHLNAAGNALYAETVSAALQNVLHELE